MSPPFNAEDDLVLEIVVFLGTCITDAAAAHFVCKSGLLDSLIDLLKAKQEDDEMVLQVVFVFHQLCLHNDVRKFIIQDTDAVAYLVRAIRHDGSALKQHCREKLVLKVKTEIRWWFVCLAIRHLSTLSAGVHYSCQ